MEQQRQSERRDIRVFLASPGDVRLERTVVPDVIRSLQYDPYLRDKVHLELVAWDWPDDDSIPMLATKSPQEMIDQSLYRPSECDIVIVIFWSRLGTPLSNKYKEPDYLPHVSRTMWEALPHVSGTVWEFLDAYSESKRSGRPDVLVYRRKDPRKAKLCDPEIISRRTQFLEVERFFKLFSNPEGVIECSYNKYEFPRDLPETVEARKFTQDFREMLERHLRARIHHVLETESPLPKTAKGRKVIPALPLWPGSPFPGLRAFTEEDAPIFFGRAPKIDGLIEKLIDPTCKFLPVVGASGSGKSSLIMAGLLPRLRAGAIKGSEHWVYVRSVLGEFYDDPFQAIVISVKPRMNRSDKLRDHAQLLKDDPFVLIKTIVKEVLDGKPKCSELFLFIDELDKLFTRIPDCHRDTFIEMLRIAANIERLRIVVSIRADVFQQCVESSALADLFGGPYCPLAPPEPKTLREMVERPAERAGLEFEDGLVDRILQDTGTASGALALMAFALRELYEERSEDGKLSHAAYEKFDGVRGAIIKRANDVCGKLTSKEKSALKTVFLELVDVDESGVASRKRAPLNRGTVSSKTTNLIDILTDNRLLVKGEKDRKPFVELAHETLLLNWLELAAWIEDRRDHLHLLKQVRSAALEWERHERGSHYLWPHERLVPVYKMLDILHPKLNKLESAFVRPEADRLLEEIDNSSTTHERRSQIGDRIAVIGDSRPGVGIGEDGLPDILWRRVPEGNIALDDLRILRIQGIFPVVGNNQVFPVKAFSISAYLITWVQYKAFLSAEDGFFSELWWNSLERPTHPGKQYREKNNCPVDTVSWYDAVAFCRWLSFKLGFEVRLPTEWEWQQAATGGDRGKKYPWGTKWASDRANTGESGLSRSTAVGMYPGGASSVGALDMVGNLCEWCLNKSDNIGDTSLDGRGIRPVRGGSFYRHVGSQSSRDYATEYANAFAVVQVCPPPKLRESFGANARDYTVGFRVCCSKPRESV